ncbi:hypothetical protein YQE_02637, partial [Dendroctonus ponderosae]
MHFLSPGQIQKYESILDKIEHEQEQFKQLTQEIERVKNELIIHKLSKLEPSQQVGYINVKVFSDIVELFHLYDDQIKEPASTFFIHQNSKFYLIEVFITNALVKKLKGINWTLFISVKYDNVCVNKTIIIKECDTPIVELLAIDENVIDCEVSASIVLPSKDNLIILLLSTVIVDISYHFEMVKKPKNVSIEKMNCEIAKSYNLELKLESNQQRLLEYKFLTKIDGKEFLKLLIQNCYHKMDLELFSEFANDSKTNVVIKFSTGVEKHSVTFNKETKVATLRSNVSDLKRLKIYFWNDNTVDTGDRPKVMAALKDLAIDSILYQFL